MARKALRTDRPKNMKRVLLIALLASAVATTVGAPPPKKPQDYTSWNDKWFVTNQGESSIVAVLVGDPQVRERIFFLVTFLPGGGVRERALVRKKMVFKKRYR